MPTTSGADIKTIGDIVHVLTKCSRPEADAAEEEICKSPEAVATLLAACGLATYATAYGGKLVVAGLASSGTTVIPGLLISGAGLLAARRFCTSAIDRAMQSVK